MQRIPFRDGGRDWDGADCWGLIHLYYREAGIELPTYGDIGATELIRVRSKISSDSGHRNWVRVGTSEEQLGDIVVMTGAMRDTSGALRHAPVHVGMVIKPGWLIHTEEEYGVMVVAFRGGHRRQEISSRVKEIYRYVHSD
jgi:cell wall-associated NlpC family hydrolase